MTGAEESYIAWDGSRYSGPPPPGWYLAVDNRWWPPQELIDGGAGGPEGARSGPAPGLGQSAANHAADPTSLPRPPASGVRPEWAPTSADGSSQAGRQEPNPVDLGVPAVPGGRPARPRSRSNRQVRKRRIRPGFVIPILIFTLFRCASDSNEQAVPDFRPPATVVATIPPTTSAPTTGDPGRITVERDGLELTITDCGPAAIRGEARNVGDRAASFEAGISVVRADDVLIQDPEDPSVTVLFGPLLPGETETYDVPLADELLGPVACDLAEVTTSLG